VGGEAITLNNLLRWAWSRTDVRRFLTIGVGSRISQTVLLWLLTELVGLHYIASSLVAVGVVMVFVFLASKFWAFDDRALRAEVKKLRMWQAQARNLYPELEELHVT
jgi:putative flippase GtrA